MEHLLEQIEKDPKNINARLQLVRKYIEDENTTEARKLLLEILDINPDNLEANFIFGQICEFEEDYERAAECFEKVINQRPGPEMKLRLAQIYENIDEYSKALEIYETLYKFNPDDNDLLEKVAHVNRISGNIEKAVECYHKLLKNDDGNIVALTQLAELYENKDKFLYYFFRAAVSEAEGAFSHAVTLYKKAVAEAENNEDIIKIRIKIAKIHAKNQQFLKEIDEYISILDIEKDNFDVYKNLAAAYKKLDNLEAAADALQSALDLNPADNEILKELFDVYSELEAHEQALLIIQKLLEKEPNKKQYKLDLARTLIALGRDSEAEEHLNKILQKNPNDTDAIALFTDYLIIREDFDSALTYAEKIKKLLPAKPFGYKKAGEIYEAKGMIFESHLNLGMYHTLKGEKQLAADEYTWAHQIQPDNIDIIMKLAAVYEEMNEKYIAAEYYQKAVDINKENIPALKKLGEIYSSLKDYTTAISSYKAIIGIDAMNKEIHYLLGELYDKVKNYDSALESYKKYVSLAPNTNNAKTAKERITKIEARINGEDDEGLLNKIMRFFSR